MTNPLASFLDDIEPLPPQLLPVDRSDLEQMALCPSLACAVRTGRIAVENNIMASGEETHKAISRTTAEHIASRGALNVGELADHLWAELRSSRPDVQPDVIAAMKASVYQWARFLSPIHPENILRFDGGGELNRSGQLGVELPSCGIIATSELDLLYSGPSPKLLHEVDYKTGHKTWSVRDVAESFQFQMHAWLVLSNYTEVDALEVRIWNTRSNRLVYPVIFERRNMLDWHARIVHAAGLFAQHMHDTAEEAPAWPTVEKCDRCPAAIFCKAARLDHGPAETLVDSLVAIDAKRAEIAKLLDGELKRRKVGEIVTEAGNAYGYGKPKRETKPKTAIYQVGKQESEAEDANSDQA